jgi:hypothetical protein
MGDKAWKQEERRVAEYFGLRRRPLSGNSRAGLGAGDLMNLDGTRPSILVEVKSWKRMPLIKHLEKTRAESEQEGVPWVFVIHEKGSQRRFAVCELAFFAKLLEESEPYPGEERGD